MQSNSVNQHQRYGFLSAFRKMIDSLESEDTLLINCIFTFFACLLLRNFLEAFAKTAANFLSVDSQSVLINLVHFDASFLAVALALSIAMYYVTKTPIIAVLKVILPCFIILSVAPVIDYFLTQGRGYGYAYFNPNEHISLIFSYLTFFGQFTGAATGIKIEVALALIGIFFYCHYKAQSYWKALLGCWLAYTIIFIYGATQFILQGTFDLVGIRYLPSGFTFLQYFFVINLLLGAWVAYLSNKQVFKSLFDEIPFLRILNYEVMFLAGMVLAAQGDISMMKVLLVSNPVIVGTFFLLIISIFFALLFAMTINNLADVDIDQISNANRALVAHKISKEAYSRIAYAFLALSFIFAIPAGTQGVFIVALLMGNYYLYSVYPLRLKRIPVISKLVISLNSLLLVLLGYWVVMSHFFINLNMSYLALFILFTLAANFIDLKDLQGDQAAGIKTLPVMIGMRKAQFFCGMAFFLCYLIVAVVLYPSPIFAFLILGGIVQFYLLTRKNYSEKPILVVYLLSLVILIMFVFASKYMVTIERAQIPMPLPGQTFMTITTPSSGMQPPAEHSHEH